MGSMRDYVYKNFHLHEKDDIIKEKVLKDTPIPANAVFVPPDLDDFVEILVTDKRKRMYTKIQDGSLKYVQKKLAQIMGPLGKIWNVVDGYANGKIQPNASMDIDELLELIEKTVLLVGQTNVACLYERRLNVLSKVFGDAKKAKKSLHQHERTIAQAQNGKLLGQEYYKVLETHSKVTKRARDISDTIGSPSKKPRTDYYQRRPFQGRPPRGNRARGGRSKGSYGDRKGRRYACRSVTSFFNGRLHEYRTNVERGGSAQYSHGSGKHKFPSNKSVHAFRGETVKIQKQLDINHPRSNDIGSSGRVQNRIREISPSICNKSTFFVRKRKSGYKFGNSRNDRKRCRGNCRTSSRQLSSSQSLVCETQKRRRSKTNFQFEKVERKHKISTFQNGGVSCSETYHTNERLDDKNRSEGRVLLRSDSQRPQEVSQVLQRGTTPAVQIPSIWSGIGSKNIHKNYETSSRTATKSRHSSSHIPRRHFGVKSVASNSDKRQKHCHLVTSKSGVCNQLEKISSTTKSNNRVPRPKNRFERNGRYITRNKNAKNCREMQNSFRQKSDNCARGGKFSRTTKLDCRGSTASVVVSKRAPNASNKKSNFKSKLSSKHNPHPGMQGRNTMVDPSSAPFQRKTNNNTKSGSSNRKRCIKSGVGSGVQFSTHGRSMVDRGEKNAHKRIRAEGGYFCSEINDKGQKQSTCALKDGQRDVCGPYKQNGGNKVKIIERPNQRPLGILSRQTNNSHKRIPAGSTQSNGRLGKQEHADLGRVEIEHPDFHGTEQNLGPSRDRPICRQVEPSSGTIHELATGSSCEGHRCISCQLARQECICIPSVLPSSEGHIESYEREIRLDSHSPNMANSDVLSDAFEHDIGVPNITSANEESTEVPIRRMPSANSEQNTEISGMESFREQSQNTGISTEASKLLVSAWRKGTQSTYNCCWRHWSSWCSERQIDPFQASVEFVIEYLTALFSKGYEYSTINGYRSAISALHFGHEGQKVGQHPLVKRLMTGIFNERPPQPRYSEMWNVDLVLGHIRSMANNDKLSLKELSLKTSMLLALVTACRTSELHKIDINHIQIHDNKVVITIAKLTKTRKAGSAPQTIEIEQYHDEILDVRRCLIEYIDRTQPLRESETQLLISYIKPHKAVKSCTIAKWLRMLMYLSGVDTSIFKAHSTRGACTSKVNKAGLSVGQIMKMAQWKSEITFRRFYDKPLQSSEQTFQDMVFNFST